MSTVVWTNGAALASLLEGASCDINYDSFGVASGTMYYSCLWEHATSLVADMKVHPDFNWLIRKSAKITREDANLAKVAITYEGVQPPPSGGDSSVYSVKYSVKGSTSSEPIESHRRFIELAGSSQATSQNGAMFEEKENPVGSGLYKFLGFNPRAVTNGASKAGMRSYYGGSVIFTETKIIPRTTYDADAVASMENLGYIDTPPHVGSYVSVRGGRNWLLISCDTEQVGNALKVSKSWKLSGPNGWDADWYTYGQ